MVPFQNVFVATQQPPFERLKPESQVPHTAPEQVKQFNCVQEGVPPQKLFTTVPLVHVVHSTSLMQVAQPVGQDVQAQVISL